MTADLEKACIFCAIASGKVPATFVCESADVVAFMDIHPIREGHVQIVPRAHHPYFDDLPLPVATQMIAMGQTIARAQKAIFGVNRASFCFSGADVAHAHAHVLPLSGMGDMTSASYIVERPLTYRLPPRMSEAELAPVAARIRALL